MSNTIIDSALAEWKYVRGLTFEAVKSFPENQWGFSPAPEFGSFIKQVRHVICCRGVFADGFVSRTIDFNKKHSFYSGPLQRDELLSALQQSTDSVASALKNLYGQSLDGFQTDYYGDALTFIEHFSAMTSHEALHRGQWTIYAALANKNS